MSLIFVRHGETALNAARTLQPADTPLSPRGLQQAAAVAARLAAMDVAGIVTSDLPRARQTAEAIVRARGGAALQATPLLQERNFGDLRGRPYDTLDFDPLLLTAAPPGGESMAAFHARVRDAFAHCVALRAQLGGPLVVVTHGLVIRALFGDCVALDAATAAPAQIGNTALTIVADAPPHAVQLVNCMRHLEGDAAVNARGLVGG